MNETQDNLSRARRLIEQGLGAGDAAVLHELVADDVVVNSGISPFAAMRGKQQFLEGLGTLAAFTFEDFVLEDLLAVEYRVVARYRARAIHSGDQLGVPATGKRITMWELRLMRWRDGQLVEDFVADINYDWPWLIAPAHPDGVGRTGLD